MDFANSINIIGLCFDILGASLMFYYTPKIDFNTYLYNKSEQESIKSKAQTKNRMIRFGMLLLAVGFCLQALALFFKS